MEEEPPDSVPTTEECLRGYRGGFLVKITSFWRHSKRKRRRRRPELLKNFHNIIKCCNAGVADSDGDDMDGAASKSELIEDFVVDEEGDKGVIKIATHTSGLEAEEDETEIKSIIDNTLGRNVEELYSEIVYEILHMVSGEKEQEELYEYLKEAFKVDEEKHCCLLEVAKSKEAPVTVLNVEVIEAKELKPNNANGLNDPYCTLYLTSSEKHRYNTTVKYKTLCPIWKEYFSLPLEKCSEDQLNIEVWDFNCAETASDKMKKSGGEKSVKGLRKLMKEIAVTAYGRKDGGVLIGSQVLPIKNIPLAGHTLWCPLGAKGKARVQGMVKLNLVVGSVKNSQVAIQEHRSLVKVLLNHELEKEECSPYSWEGKFSSKGELLLARHSAQAGIDSNRRSLAQWIEYVSMHEDHPVHFVVFSQLLEALVPALKGGTTFSEDEEILFWNFFKKLLPLCLNYMTNEWTLSKDDENSGFQLRAFLRIFAHLKTLKCPEGMELFPPPLCSPSKNAANGHDVDSGLQDAATQSAQKWFNFIAEKTKIDEESYGSKIEHAIKITHMVECDLQLALDFHDKHFQEILHFSFARVLYKVYDYELSEIVKPIVMDACWKLKPLRFPNNPEDALNDSEHLQFGTSLFELYLILQRFANLSKGIHSLDLTDLKMQDYHHWFSKGVVHWLDIALFKAMQRIEKAVELDTLVPVYSSVRYSSSAVDTLSICCDIKIFWSQLSWPHVEGSYSFISKIIDDICRCSVYYADIMTKRVDGTAETKNGFEKKFEVTNEWCSAVNNLGYILESLAPFFEGLGIDTFLEKLAGYQSDSEVEHCKEKLKLAIKSTEETVGCKIVNLIQKISDKMSLAIQGFLQEGAKSLNHESNTLGLLFHYLEDNVMTLYSSLSTEHFDRALEMTWEKVEKILQTMIEIGLKKCHPPSYFAYFHKALRMLLSFFWKEEQHFQNKVQENRHIDEDGCEEGDDAHTVVEGRNARKKKIERLESLLSLHGMETCELIHQYHLERLGEQILIEANEQGSSSLGLITVRLQFEEDFLRIEIMNCRNLKPMNSNGSSNPYVRIYLCPEKNFMGIKKLRTKTHKKTLFPLFDEVFTISMSSELLQTKDPLVHFVIKHYERVNANAFIGEAYIPFSKIPSIDKTIGLENLPQVHLPLTRPTNPDSKFLLALKRRHGDKLARDFYKSKKSLL